MVDKKELNVKLRKSAIESGLCDDWQKMWEKDWSLDKMVERFYQGIDFFLEKRFMSNQFIKDNFDKDFRRKNGVLVDDKYSLLNPEHAILIGESVSTIRYNGTNCATIYITDQSSAKVIAKNMSFVLIHILGNAKVECQQEHNAKVVAILHSHEASVVSDGNATIREEYNYLK